MITPEQVEVALAKLNDEDDAAATFINDMRAENECDEVFARAYLSYNDGAVETRKMRARVDPAFLAARKRYEQAHAALKKYEARIKGASKIIDIYQTQSANARQSEWIK